MFNSPIEETLHNVSDLVELLRFRFLHQPEKTAYTFLKNGEIEEATLTYQKLDSKARSIAVQLQSIGVGERALLIYPPGLEYIAAFFGCLYAGVIAVPAYPPNPGRPERNMPRLKGIVKSAQPFAALTTSKILAVAEPLFSQDPDFEKMHILASDNLAEVGTDEWQKPALTRETLAFLQYTSGSTGRPKGVMVNHGNLLHNLEYIRRAFELTQESVSVTWLPSFHDMGLIDGVIQPLYTGFTGILMSPASFLQKPVRWLNRISHYRATHCGGPNFAYELCVRKIKPEQMKGLDLSSWLSAYNGAEPVRKETLEQFITVFKPFGFHAKFFYPCFGLAEATLMVSGSPLTSEPVYCAVQAEALEQNRIAEVSEENPDARHLVGSGISWLDTKVVIVNPRTLAKCEPDEVGEVWVSCPSVAQGYWCQPEETRQTFHAYLSDTGQGPFLRTGDMGFFRNKELFITGRLKDIIIIRGRNHYPQDIELTVEKSYPRLRPGCSAAFEVEAEGEKRLVVVAEVERRHKKSDRKALVEAKRKGKESSHPASRRQETLLPDFNLDDHQPLDTDMAAEAIRKAVSEQHELQVYAVLLLKMGTIPKTSSGKLERHSCRTGFLNGTLDVVGSNILEKDKTPASRISLDRESLLAADPEKQHTLLESYFENLISTVAKTDISGKDPNQPLTSLGIDSIMAIALGHSLEADLGTALPITRFLEGPSITQLKKEVLEQLESGKRKPETGNSKSDNQVSSFNLSHNQKSLWFMHQLAPDSAAYNVFFAVRIISDTDIPALRRSFQTLVSRHPSLRTTYALHDGEPVQHIRDDPDLRFDETDASDWNENELNARLTEEARHPFDLENGPVLRVSLFNLSANKHILLLNVHHIAIDLWSFSAILDELRVLYPFETRNSGKQFPVSSLEPVNATYGDYVHWQAQMLSGHEGDRLLTYWQKQLSGELPMLNLPADYPRPPVQTYNGASHAFRLNRDLTKKIKDLSQASGATLFMTLLAAFQVLLYRYTGQDDILVGTPAAARSMADFKSILGYFVNPLVMRSDLSGNPPFRTFLGKVCETVLEALAHQAYPFQLLVEQLKPDRESSRPPLFQVMFVLQRPYRVGASAPFVMKEAGARMNLGGLEMESVALDHRIAQFDLTLTMVEMDEGLSASLEYNTDLFKNDTVVRMASHFQTLLEGIAADPDQSVSDLPLLTEHERHQLTVEWNDTETEYSQDKTIVDMFEEQVERNPDNTAVIFEDTQISYHELNEQANHLAHFLIKYHKIQPDDRVGLFLERSDLMIVGIMGILKSGGAYVPIEPGYPRDRIRYMINDSGCKAVVSETKVRPFSDIQAEFIDICDVGHENHANPKSSVSPRHLAYVIYTSGSTGYPKGVAIEHRSLSDYVNTFIREFGIGSQDRVLQQNTITFDASIEEIYPALCTSAAMVICRDNREMDMVFSSVVRYRITILSLSPLAVSYFNTRAYELGNDLRILISGGDVLHPSFTDNLHRKTILYNTYGPTEATVCSTFYRIDRMEESLPIGKPIANRRIYILDSVLNPVPIGVTGEIFIAGPGTARGYLNQDELTKEKFMPNPFRQGDRMYRTGDLGRWMPDGTIEFMGRNDEQVKVRGYRLELGEIRNRLLNHEPVQDAVIIARDFRNNGMELAAYVVSPDNLNAEALRNHLKTDLPGYMIPSYFIRMDRLPLLPGGKVDRRALPEPDELRPQLETAYAQPRTGIEKQIADVWQDVLKLEKVGVHDNFFDLGGHSLLIIQVQKYLQKIFNRDMPVVNLFRYPTIAAFSQYLSQENNDEKQSCFRQIHDRAGRQKKAVKRRRQLKNQKNQRK